MSIELEECHCEQCDEERPVNKIPSSFFSFKKGTAGGVVKEFISDAKESLAEQRREARGTKYVDADNTSDS